MNAGSCIHWIDYNYTKLHEQILEATHVSISVRTLKRIFRGNDNYDPQMATKNAMAQYLGFSDWADFSQTNFDDNPTPQPAESSSIKSAPGANPVAAVNKRKRNFRWVASIILMVAVSALLWSLLFKHETVSFNVKSTSGSVPLTAAISYDLSNFSYKNAFIDFGSGGEYKLLLNPKGELAYQYKTPNFFKMRLLADGRTLASAVIDAHTSDWACYVGNNDVNAQVITDRSQFTNDSSLYFPPAAIRALNIDVNKEYWVDYRNIRNFHIDGDQMAVEFRLRNSRDIGGFDCYDTSLEFTGENGRGRFKFVKPGCTQYADTEFGDTKLTGNFHNLSSLGIDLSKWTVVRIETSHKTSMVYINNVFKFKTAYHIPIGNIRGFFCRFKGSGQLDFIRVYDASHRLVYHDEFNTKKNPTL